jgi:hypothetical protein
MKLVVGLAIVAEMKLRRRDKFVARQKFRVGGTFVAHMRLGTLAVRLNFCVDEIIAAHTKLVLDHKTGPHLKLPVGDTSDVHMKIAFGDSQTLLDMRKTYDMSFGMRKTFDP